MVNLSYKLQIEADMNEVWEYFSQFHKITEWDPNTRKCEIVEKKKGEVGSIYNITTFFNKK